jgi:hypothetical protein
LDFRFLRMRLCLMKSAAAIEVPTTWEEIML